jgi:hypothetical protein
MQSLMMIFLNTRCGKQKSAWLNFKEVCLNFIGNVKAQKYKELVEDLLSAYQTMGHNMSFEDSFLTLQLGLFLSEFGGSEQQIWGMFHQDISTMEKG